MCAQCYTVTQPAASPQYDTSCTIIYGIIPPLHLITNSPMGSLKKYLTNTMLACSPVNAFSICGSEKYEFFKCLSSLCRDQFHVACHPSCLETTAPLPNTCMPLLKFLRYFARYFLTLLSSSCVVYTIFSYCA